MYAAICLSLNISNSNKRAIYIILTIYMRACTCTYSACIHNLYEACILLLLSYVLYTEEI